MGAAQARMVDLFTEGAIALVNKDGKDLVVAWVNKLNAFEKEDCDRASRGARAKRILSWEANEDEQALFQYETGEWDDDAIAQAIVNNDAAKHYVEAISDLRTDEKWTDRLDYLAEVDVLGVAGPDASEEDRALWQKVSTEYQDEIDKRYQRKQSEAKDDLLTGGREKLIVEYRKRYRDAQGAREAASAYRQAEIFYAARECKATKKNDEWDHARCNHQVRLLGARTAVREMPDIAHDAIVSILDALTMSYEDAGNSVAPTDSSESSGQQSEEADSSPSTQTETSPEPVGT